MVLLPTCPLARGIDIDYKTITQDSAITRDGFDIWLSPSNICVMQTDSSSVRLDLWLWRARFFKTRALSVKACESGHIRLERFGKVARIEKASTAVKPDDHLIFAIGTRLFDIVIISAGERRGPASEAQSLYRQASATPNTTTNAWN